MLSSPNDSIQHAVRIRGTGELLMVATVIFAGLAAMGLPLPALPDRLHTGLGLDLTTVGCVMGLQSAATLISRPWAGKTTDRHGARRSVMMGLAALIASGIAYAASTLPALDRQTVLDLLIAGRLLTGVGGGLVVTGGGAWAIGLAGMERAGRAMSWIGLAMFGGFATGAAIGAILDFPIAAGLVIVAALIGIATASATRAVRSDAQAAGLLIGQVVARIWRSGLALACSTVGFSAISAFSVLAFSARGWPNGENAIAIFGVGHVAARFLLGSLADKAKGPAAAVVVLTVEAVGLGLLWLASAPIVALAGAGLAGFGFSMVYPLMALPALRSVPQTSRGLAIGIYDAFYDVAMAGSMLICGSIASFAGVGTVFLFAAGAAVMAMLFVVLAYHRVSTAFDEAAGTLKHDPRAHK